jgi:hypothetical protein
MRMFDVQSIEMSAAKYKVFAFLRVPENLPRWAEAFVSAGNGRARLETPAGAVDVALRCQRMLRPAPWTGGWNFLTAASASRSPE